MKTLKYSRQREAIRAFLASRKDHPTAEVIYENVKQEFPNISLGTVYRNLTLLESTGDIQKLTFSGDCDHFDFNTDEHYHFVCTECKSVIDLEMDSLNFINCLAEKNFGGTIEGNKVFFYGKCEKCHKKALTNKQS